MMISNQKVIKNFRTLLNKCCEPKTKVDLDTLRDMDNLLSGLSNFMGDVKHKVHGNLQEKVRSHREKLLLKGK